MNFLKALALKFKCPLTKEEKALLNELVNEYEVTGQACDYYRNNIKNNQNDTYFIVRNKLIRNIVLGKTIMAKPYITVTKYGNLTIYRDDLNNEIYWLTNVKGYTGYHVKIDKNKKKWIEKRLGLK